MEGVVGKYLFTASWLLRSSAYPGIFFFPPLGNALAEINPPIPFAFWAFLSAAGLVVFYFTMVSGRKMKKIS